MFSTNFSIQIKQSILVKKTKITDYGMHGEMKPSGFKTSLYKMLNTKKSKYMTITGIDIEWSPTAPHLLEKTIMSIKVKDHRASGSSDLGDLIYMRKSAGKKWSIHVDLSLSSPSKEMFQKPPISFDIDIQSGSMKSGVEIGHLKINAFIIASNDVSQSVIRDVSYTAKDEDVVLDDFLIWKGMPKNGELSKDGKMTSLVEEYLKGNFNLDTLGKKICSILV
nr:TPA_asm: P3 [Heliosperma gammacytorhabdovirus 1]